MTGVDLLAADGRKPTANVATPEIHRRLKHMSDPTPRPEINLSKIHFGGGIAGLIFTIGSMLIFLLGIPGLWYFFAFAVALGIGFAVAFRLAVR